jgi:Flp pilus assembly protein TadB
LASSVNFCRQPQSDSASGAGLVFLLLLLLLPPLVLLLLLLLLLLLFFWQFKEKIKRNCRQTPAAKLAESSTLQVACVCARCSM